MAFFVVYQNSMNTNAHTRRQIQWPSPKANFDVYVYESIFSADECSKIICEAEDFQKRFFKDPESEEKRQKVLRREGGKNADTAYFGDLDFAYGR